MRARYSAHVKVDVDFIYKTTHPDHREGYDHKGTKIWAENSEWHGLEILSTTEGGPKDDQGEVEFIARFRDKNGVRSHHERGQFERKRKKWLFTTGSMVKSQPLSSEKIGRNDPCTCGSGKNTRSAAENNAPARIKKMELTAKEFAANRGGKILVDIRRVDEWRLTGVIDGAHLLTFLMQKGMPTLQAGWSLWKRLHLRTWSWC